MDNLGSLLCPLLIGRDEMLELADRRLGDAAAGRGQFMLVAGDAGIGKSRLVDAIVRKAAARGFSHACGAVAPQDHEVPAASFLDLARTMARDPRFAGLGRELLDLRDAVATAERRRRRMVVFDVVDRIAASIGDPAVLVFEDLHWTDDLSLEILGELARRLREEPVLLIGAYRTDELPPGSSLREWRARLLGQRLAEEIRLAPLTMEQTALMTTLILDTGLPAPRAVGAAVFERTDGVPLHVEELLGAMRDRDRADGQAIRDAVVPDTIEDAVLERLARRSAEAQAVARAGAVIGRCFAPDVLAGIMDLPPETIDAPLAELVDHDVLDAPLSNGFYDFRHQVLRDVLYGSVPDRERRRLHARAAEFGARLEGASVVHASLHFERAGMHAEAYAAALAGAEAAALIDSHREAYPLYRRAIDHLPEDVDPAERARLLCAYADEAAAVDESEIGERALTEAIDIYRKIGMRIDAAWRLSDLVSLQRRLGRPVADRIALVERAVSDIDDLSGTTRGAATLASLLDELARTYLQVGRLEDAARVANEAVRMAARGGDVEIGESLRTVVASVDVRSGDFQAGWAGFEQAIAVTLAGAIPAGVSAFRDAASTAAYVMDYPRSERYITDGIAFADRIEQSYCRHVLAATHAEVLAATGRWDEAGMEAGQVLADRRGGVWASIVARVALATVSLGRGDLERSRLVLEEARTLGLEAGEIGRILPALSGLAETAWLSGDPATTIALADEALDRCAPVGEAGLLVPFVVLATRSHIAVHRPERAEAWLTACGRVLEGSPLPGATVALRHGTGLLQAASGSPGLARASLAEAVAGWDQLGRVWEAAWARLDLAADLIRIGRHAEAATAIAEARRTGIQLQSPLLIGRADALGHTARGRAIVREPWAPLTTREFEVARLIADGMTNAEIADELAIAPKTASSHVEHILAKLGANRRTEIAAWVANVGHSADGLAEVAGRTATLPERGVPARG